MWSSGCNKPGRCWKMLSALNNVIILLCSIKWRGVESLKKFDEKIFWATVLLALPDEVFEKGEDYITQIRKILLDKFVVRSNGIIEIWGHDVWDSEIAINDIPIGICGILEYNQWESPAERENFIRVMLIYPLVTRLYEIYEVTPALLTKYLEDIDCLKQESLDLKSAEKIFRKYKTSIEEIIPRIDRNSFSRYGQAMQKGYFLIKTKEKVKAGAGYEREKT